MVDVQTQIIINRSIESVRSYVSDPDNAPSWYVNIKSIEWETPRPLRVGSRLSFRAEFLGKNLEYIYEVAKIDDSAMIMKTADGPFPMETTYLWVKLSDKQTKMTLRNRGKPKGFSKFFTPFMRLAMLRANTKDLKRLKQILERK